MTLIAHGLTSDDYFYFFIYPIIWIIIIVGVFAAPLIVNYILKKFHRNQLNGKQILFFYLLIIVQIFYYDLQAPIEIDRKGYTLTMLMLLLLSYILNYLICRCLFKSSPSKKIE